MKTTVTESEFVQAFDDMNRADNFSTEGRRALYQWIEELEDGTETETELDVIGLCCEFSEYATLTECWLAYNDPEPTGEIPSLHEQREYITDRSFLIEFDSGVIIQDF